MSSINIAIDGYSSCGKSTLAKQLAKELGYIYVDTGAMYRAVTLFALKAGFIKAGHFNIQALLNKLPELVIRFETAPEPGDQITLLNGEDVSRDIRSMKVADFVSRVAEIKEVRAHLVCLQQQMAKDKGVVMDGRDIGTVVIPNAELKIFMTASEPVRAQRRYDELVQKGVEVDYSEVLKNLKKRDHIDENRKESPLIKADDARILDNTELSKTAQFQTVLQWVKKAGGA